MLSYLNEQQIKSNNTLGIINILFLLLCCAIFIHFIIIFLKFLMYLFRKPEIIIKWLDIKAQNHEKQTLSAENFQCLIIYFTCLIPPFW